MRAGAPWCSLCYLDLRAPSRLATVPAARDSDETRVAAPLVDASLEPRPAGWSALPNAEVVDAEFVESPPRPATPQRPPDEARWPCSCGAYVTIDQTTCPACGGEFLGALKSDGVGRHRRGSGGPRIQSRAARLGLAGLVAVVLAIAIPLLLAVIG